MMQWAQADLARAAATPGVQWLVVAFHQPPYTKGSHDSDTEIELVEMRTRFLPVLVSVKRTAKGHQVYTAYRLLHEVVCTTLMWLSSVPAVSQ
jgi:hypothetical protein